MEKIWENKFFGEFIRRVDEDEKGEEIFWQTSRQILSEHNPVKIICTGDEEGPNIRGVDWLEEIIKGNNLQNHTSLHHHLECISRKYHMEYEQYYDWMDYFKINDIYLDEITNDSVWCDVTFQYLTNRDFKITIEFYNLIPNRTIVGEDII